jgi:hypothetical protein
MRDDEFDAIGLAPTDSEAVDALLSALLDGALSTAEREDLEARLAREPALAARLDRLRGVDDVLRGLASEALSDRDPKAGLDRLERRLESAPAGGPGPWRGPLALGLAAAAAWILYLGLSSDASAPPSDLEPHSAVARSMDPAQLDEGLAIGLGDAEDPDVLLLVPELIVEDLEIIERLELLEYLAARDGEGHG